MQHKVLISHLLPCSHRSCIFCFVLLLCGPYFSLQPSEVKSKAIEVKSSGGGGVLPYKRLMEMCRRMGSHLHDWIDYNGVSFSMELLAWGCTFSDFWGKTVLHIYGLQMYQNVYISGEK